MHVQAINIVTSSTRHLVNPLPPQPPLVSTISPRRDEQQSSVLVRRKVALLLPSHPGRHVCDCEGAVKDTTRCFGQGHGGVDGERSGVAERMLGDVGPVGVRLALRGRERQVFWPVLGVGGCDGCRHEARCRVDELARGVGAVCLVGNRDAIQSARLG